MKITALLLPLISVLLLFPETGLQARQNTGSDFQQANRLMQQENFTDALPILKNLHQDNPDAFIFFDRYIECLIALNRLDEAEETARRQLGNERLRIQPSLHLAEILHLKNQTGEAFTIWQQLVDNNPQDIQTYYSVASSMNQRREYNAAAETYETAREILQNPTLFLNELANSYMQAGRFEEAVKEYFRLVIESPDQIAVVQQRFLRSRDENLYQIAAMELEDLLLESDISETSYSQLYQLLTWFLLETSEFERALNFARYYEQQTPYTIYSLMGLGHQLKSAGEYEYAAEAYSYYAQNDAGMNKLRAMEELAFTYLSWGRELQQNNTASEIRINNLFQSAYDTAANLLANSSNYDNADRVYSLLIDLSLDYFKDQSLAKTWYNELTEHVSPDDAYAYFAEGRIALFEKDFIKARQALTRSDRNTEASDLSERARYYLGLSDFFEGDFEFAEIQLNTLERRYTSFYSNDALKLRTWIRMGTRADSTGSLLMAVGESLHAFHSGDYQEGLALLEPLLAVPGNPLTDDLVAELSSILPAEYDPFTLLLLERQIESRSSSPLMEKMMWDRALISEQLLNRVASESAFDSPFYFEFMQSSFHERIGQIEARLTPEYISDLYEELIIRFPGGLYSSYAREKLQDYESIEL
jgi:tetratricopeptide (TPR) repeat protein